MTKVTFKNGFHGTETTIETLSAYEAQDGFMICTVDGKKYDAAAKELCGQDDCMCGKIGQMGLGADDRDYYVNDCRY